MNVDYVFLDSLWKVYGAEDGFVAARDVTMSIAPGEFVTLLGPSGSGKTTTLMMVAGFVKPTKGEIYINGRDVTRVPPQRRNCSMVFQNYALFPHLDVFGNIAFPLEMRGMKRSDIGSRVEEMLKLVQLPGYEKRYPHQLSGGQQQRVALARALVFEPQVLLMDEPLAALDKKLRQQLQLEIKQIQRRLGITVISVTHDQVEALTMSDRVAVMNEGRVVQIGTPHELYEEPQTAFVADFVGETNFLEGVVKARTVDGLTCVEHAGGRILQASGRSSQTVGDRVKMAIRPERIALSPVGKASGSPPQDGWQGTVSDVVYAGDTVRYNVAVGDDSVFTVAVQNRDAQTAFSRDQAVMLSWNPTHMKIVTA